MFDTKGYVLMDCLNMRMRYELRACKDDTPQHWAVFTAGAIAKALRSFLYAREIPL
jgi:hypothetical protein